MKTTTYAGHTITIDDTGRATLKIDGATPIGFDNLTEALIFVGDLYLSCEGR
jgi:hypothetical protein